MSAKITHPLVFRLQRALEARKISVPRFGNEVHIPKDRIYKWFQEGTSPKANDQQKILRWLDGEMENHMEKKPVTEPSQDWQKKYYALLEEANESYRKAINTMGSQREELTNLKTTVDELTKKVEALDAIVPVYREWTIDELVASNLQRDEKTIRAALYKKQEAAGIKAEHKDIPSGSGKSHIV